MIAQSSTVLLKRLYGLREPLPFYLIVDSLLQSGHFTIEEIVLTSKADVIYVSFETINRPDYAVEFIDFTKLTSVSVKEIISQLDPVITNLGKSQTKRLVVFDSLNYIDNVDIGGLISGVLRPDIVTIGIFHSSLPSQKPKVLGYPDSLDLLQYMASSIFRVFPLTVDEEAENKCQVGNYTPNINWNTKKYRLDLHNKRKSGRTLSYKYIIENGEASPFVEVEPQQTEDDSMLEGLTTFNLTTTKKQQLAREQVELPYMEAQASLGSSGGAIVYEFEKDDDYDEEDPYEDPF